MAEDMAAHAAEMQEKVLHTILQRNAHTEYLDHICGLKGRTDPASFKKCVPVVSHPDLQPLFERIANGDPAPILTAEPVTTLSLSSGTTSDGQQKYLILYKEILQASLELFKIGSAYRARHFPIRAGGRVLELVFCGKISTSKGGLITGTATTHLFRSEEFRLKQASTKVRACSPVEVMNGCDNMQSMYCHLLCGLLYQEEVEYVTSTFAYTLVEALRLFEMQWKNICEDIRHGHLSDWITDGHVRDAISHLLHGGDPELADIITHKCLMALENDWHGIIPHLWPNCKYVLSIITGSMEHYVNKVQHYAGNVPLVSGDYGATETWVAVNTNPKSPPNNVSYTVVPSFAYFEFIPLQGNNHNELDLNKSLSLTEVEVGQQYELVITTYGGLYRYRLGDVVRVTGFLNSSPQLAFVCRKNVALCINIDKNTEKDLQKVVEKAASKLLVSIKDVNGSINSGGVELVDYTSFADLSTTPGHYVIFWELSSIIEESARILQECASVMDLAFVDPGYVGSRRVHTIGPLELCIVRAGTFRSLLDRYLAKGAAITQYKTPRCLASSQLIEILRSSVLTSSFSSAYE